MASTRQRSPLAVLTATQRDTLAGWFRDGVAFAEIVQRIKAQFGVSTSKPALVNYHERWGRELIAAQGIGPAALRNRATVTIVFGQQGKPVLDVHTGSEEREPEDGQ